MLSKSKKKAEAQVGSRQTRPKVQGGLDDLGPGGLP